MSKKKEDETDVIPLPVVLKGNEVDASPKEEAKGLDYYDPMGLSSVFMASGIPAMEDAPSAVYEYVQKKAESVNDSIKKNRGLPPLASPSSMLSQEEKAIVILGYAVGAGWAYTVSVINAHRAARGQELYAIADRSRDMNRLSKRHGNIVDAIREDILGGMEAFSPLTHGTSRMIWRARLLEEYRKHLIRFAIKGDVEGIRDIDRSMKPHMSFFDKLSQGSNIANMLHGASENLRKQNEKRASRVRSIQEMFDKGEITDVQRIDMLRELND